MIRPLTPLLALALASACADQAPTEAAARDVRPTFVLVAEGTSCHSEAGMHARPVEVGTAGDSNRNGIVCERDEGLPELPSLVRYDDVPPTE